MEEEESELDEDGLGDEDGDGLLSDLDGASEDPSDDF